MSERIGKFDCNRDAVLYSMTLGAWSCRSSGDVEAPTGFFAEISNKPNELAEIVDAFEEDIEREGLTDTAELIGEFLLREDSQGFVGVDEYDTEAMLKAAYDELERQYSEWEGDDE